VSEADRPGYRPAGPALPPGSYRPSPIPPRSPRPLRKPLLIIVICAAVVLGLVAGMGRAGWQADPTSLLSSPWEHSAGPPLAHLWSSSSGLVDASALDTGVVDIYTRLGYQNAAGAGTGIVLSPSGDVLTNNHVINGATSISVTDVGTGRSYPATVVGYDRSHDIAVLKLRGASGLPAASIGNSNSVAVGDQVAAVGNAGGVGGPPSVALGRVSALDRTITASDGNGGSAQQLTGLIQVTANVQPGDSGGPLVNTAGQVVGIDTAATTGFRFESTRGQGFAIPINDAIAIAKQIQSGAGSPTIHIGPTGVLGIAVQDTDTPVGLSPWGRFDAIAPGATVVGVLQDSPAEQAGLATGDTIVAVDQTAIDSASTLTSVLNRHHPGDSVRVTWIDRSGQQQDATVQLAIGPPS
jgi:S1-C subfamily serine protease